MEFFQHIAAEDVDIDELKGLLTIARLPELCASIDTAREENRSVGDIYCLWGAFDIGREEIRYGVRFSLLSCPHALAWSITYHAEINKVVIHCTIDETQPEVEFVESIELFMNDWSIGISGIYSSEQAETN